MEPTLREFSYQNWITAVIIGALVLLAFIKTLYHAQFTDFVKINSAERYINTRTKSSFFFSPIQLVLFFLQCIGIALLFYASYCVLQKISLKENYLIFIIIFSGYFLFEIIKIVIEQIIGYTLLIYRKMSSFVYKRFNIKNVLGLLGLFFTIIITYQTDIPDFFIFGSITIIVSFYILSQVWLLKKYSKEFIKFPLYFILYFCTLEIAPYYILYKFIING